MCTPGWVKEARVPDSDVVLFPEKHTCLTTVCAAHIPSGFLSLDIRKRDDFGGLGLRSAVRTAAAAYWASWGDSLGMIQQRHPAVARTLVHELVGGQSQSVHLLAASMAAAQLTSLDGFEVPSWARSRCR